MTTKNAEKAKGQSVPKMEVKKPNTTTAAQTATKAAEKKNTVEELEKQVQQLKAKLQTVPQDLTARIDYFNNKKELIRKLGKLEASHKNLQDHLDNIAEVSAADDFETDEFVLSIEAGTKYSKNQVFALQNPVLIGDVLTFLMGKMEAKIEGLKKEIEA
nr:hypothetical protein [uncultured Draconibacterium sp.]